MLIVWLVVTWFGIPSTTDSFHDVTHPMFGIDMFVHGFGLVMAVRSITRKVRSNVD